MSETNYRCLKTFFFYKHEAVKSVHKVCSKSKGLVGIFLKVILISKYKQNDFVMKI